MKRILTLLTLLTLLTSAQASVTPAYAPHNRVPGNTPTMTNIQAWAAALVTSGISAETATNIADAVVASSNLCSVAAAQQMTNATLSAAKQDAEDKYLPLDGSKYMTGDLEIGNTKQIRWSQGGDSGSISYERFVGGWITFRGANNYWFYNNSGDEFSHLNPDGTPVMTEGLLMSTFPIVTNAYTKAEVGLALTNFVSHTNVRFSNEVLAVGFGVSSNDVAAIREMVGTIGDLPVGGGAATLGGLLAALVASVVWLKSNKLTKGMTAGVPDDPNVSALFTSANTSLMSTINGVVGTPNATLAAALSGE